MAGRLVPGLLVLVAIGLAARLVAAVAGANYLIVAIVIGLVVGNAWGVPAWARRGVATHTLWLEVGIVVMGASVALDQVFAAGPRLLVLVVATVATTMLVVELLARFVFSIHEDIGSLLAAGSGICGVSAVVALAESISADETHIAYAAATVLLFDATTLFVYPLVGHALGLSDVVFGVWAGLTMFSTGPVSAAGFAFSETAGQWAVLVKLARNSLIGLAVVVYVVYYARRRGRATDGAPSTDEPRAGWRALWETFPKFIVGFVGVMVLANVGLFSDQQTAWLANASDWAFLFAFAGLGLDIHVDDLRTAGYRPVATVLTGLLLVATTMLLVVQALF
ncbi:YeiH family protein [Halomarina ordinaria]|uniref:YeiH family protein n=1 Tax=Halomarina ordinaria TaxID=3033939 RepID=A0ABD5U718_9EURY|nr:putative sulfate exporter family transporter [Halomarina sp. PSRA2]